MAGHDRCGVIERHHVVPEAVPCRQGGVHLGSTELDEGRRPAWRVERLDGRRRAVAPSLERRNGAVELAPAGALAALALDYLVELIRQLAGALLRASDDGGTLEPCDEIESRLEHHGVLLVETRAILPIEAHRQIRERSAVFENAPGFRTAGAPPQELK